MLGKAHNLLIRHHIYRALPHREGGGVPRDIATDHYDREAVRAQLRKELKRIRNMDMFAHLCAHVVRVHARTARGAASIPASILARAGARPPIKPTATRTFASLLQPAASGPSTAAIPSAPARTHRSTSRPPTKTIGTTRPSRTKHNERDSTKPLNIAPSLPQTGQHPYAPTNRYASAPRRPLPSRPPRHASRYT